MQTKENNQNTSKQKPSQKKTITTMSISSIVIRCVISMVDEGSANLGLIRPEMDADFPVGYGHHWT